MVLSRLKSKSQVSKKMSQLTPLSIDDLRTIVGGRGEGDPKRPDGNLIIGHSIVAHDGAEAASPPADHGAPPPIKSAADADTTTAVKFADSLKPVTTELTEDKILSNAAFASDGSYATQPRLDGAKVALDKLVEAQNAGAPTQTVIEAKEAVIAKSVPEGYDAKAGKALLPNPYEAEVAAKAKLDALKAKSAPESEIGAAQASYDTVKIPDDYDAKLAWLGDKVAAGKTTVDDIVGKIKAVEERAKSLPETKVKADELAAKAFEVQSKFVVKNKHIIPEYLEQAQSELSNPRGDLASALATGRNAVVEAAMLQVYKEQLLEDLRVAHVNLARAEIVLNATKLAGNGVPDPTKIADAFERAVADKDAAVFDYAGV